MPGDRLLPFGNIRFSVPELKRFEMTPFRRSLRALAARGILLALTAAAVPACKHKSSHAGPGSLGFSAPVFTANESGTTVTITVTRTDGSVGAVTVDFFTGNGSATTGNDFISSSGQLSWADGEMGDRTFTVPITSDATVEGEDRKSVV